MRRAVFVLLAMSCAQYNTASLTFGESGEGLDGFLCKQGTTSLLDRGADPATTSRPVSIVADIVGIDNGQPGCRTGQLLAWCKDRTCAPMKRRRVCKSAELPTRVSTLEREDVRAQVRASLRASLTKAQFIEDAPDEFVIVRLVGTSQPCSEVEETADGVLPEFDTAKLIGCAYSCPVLLDRATDVYLGFDGFVGQCEQGVRICAAGTLNWMP
ncbi:MAG: hypothetical protein JNK82_12815 [Myxococcaceae bacterium]|nr:hypothetical protein [Myxococcaceae bacterium]